MRGRRRWRLRKWNRDDGGGRGRREDPLGAPRPVDDPARPRDTLAPVPRGDGKLRPHVFGEELEPALAVFVVVVLAAAAGFGPAVHEAVAPVVLRALRAAGFGRVHEKVGPVDERVALVVSRVLDLAHRARFASLVANLLHRVGDENFSLLLGEAPGRERDLRAPLPRRRSRGQLGGVLVLETASAVAVRRRGSSASALRGAKGPHVAPRVLLARQAARAGG